MPASRSKKTIVRKLKKRTSEAESALMQQYKNEIRLKEQQQDLNCSYIEYAKLQSEQTEIDSRKEILKHHNEKREKLIKKVYDLTGLTKFRVNKDGSHVISATLEDLKNACFLLHQLTDVVKHREVKSQKRLDLTFDTFYRLNFQMNIKNDMLQIYRSQESNSKNLKNSKDETRKIGEKRRRLIKHISSITRNVYIKNALNKKRLQSGKKAKRQSLEEYLDNNMKNAKKELIDTNKKIKVLDIKIKDLNNIITERKEEIASIKKSIKDFPKRDIRETEHYQKLANGSEKIQDEIDKGILRFTEMKEEVDTSFKNLDEKYEKAIADLEILNGIEVMLEISKEAEKAVREKEIGDSNGQYEEIVGEIEEGEYSFREMVLETKTLEKKCEEKLNKLNEIKLKSYGIYKETEACVQQISEKSQETLSKLWYNSPQ